MSDKFVSGTVSGGAPEKPQTLEGTPEDYVKTFSPNSSSSQPQPLVGTLDTEATSEPANFQATLANPAAVSSKPQPLGIMLEDTDGSAPVTMHETIQPMASTVGTPQLTISEEPIIVKPQITRQQFVSYRVTSSGQQIRSENIQISPFKITSLLSMQITQAQGDHAVAAFKGVVEEAEAKRILKLAGAQVAITISRRSEAGKTAGFYEGVATDLSIYHEGGVYYVEGQAASYTYLMDIKRKKRSYQFKEQSYEQLVNQVVSGYQEGAFLDTISNGKKTGQFLTQYEETDWGFIQRLASHFNRQPVALDQFKSPKFYFGLPNASVVGEIDSYKFHTGQDISSYRQLNENQSTRMVEHAFLRYHVETAQLFVLGDKVKFLGEEWFIVAIRREIEKGALANHYQLSKQQGVLIEKQYNHQLIGSSLIGTVKAVQSDKVLLDLEIDGKNSQAAHWFAYSTNYTSDDNVGWYMMPETGEKVRLYYPTKNEKDAVAMATVRTQDNSEDALNPAIKTLRNKYGKTITLEPDKITIVGNGVEIILNDQSGINITSTGNVSVTADGALTMKGRNVVMDASDSVNISSHGNTVVVNDKIILNGSEIKMN